MIHYFFFIISSMSALNACQAVSIRQNLLSSLKKASNGFDMRGIVDDIIVTYEMGSDGPQLLNESAFWVGFGFAKYLLNRFQSETDEIPKIGIGRDSRTSGPLLTAWLSAGVEAAGAHGYDVGICTTPAMYLSCTQTSSSVNEKSSSASWPFDGAISVTASHLPSQWNGFKLFTATTPSNIGGEGIDEIISEIDKPVYDTIIPALSQNKRTSSPFLPTYSRMLQSTLRQLTNSNDHEVPLAGLKICVNAGNGAGGFLAQTLSELGADTQSSIHLDPDGTFPNHIANPEDKIAISTTAARVRACGADLGICLDTDADRVGLVDGSGRLLNRNCLVALVSKVALKHAPRGSVVVTDSATSNGVTQFIESTLGGCHVRYKKGYRYVIEKAREIPGSVLAVECSGHGAWAANGWVDDGCYTAIRLLAELCNLRSEKKVATSTTTASRSSSSSSSSSSRSSSNQSHKGTDNCIPGTERTTTSGQGWGRPTHASPITFSDLLDGLQEPAESVELRLRILGGKDGLSAASAQALAAFHSVATVTPGWYVEPVNYEGLRVNFRYTCDEQSQQVQLNAVAAATDYSITENPKRAGKDAVASITGWCMLRPSLHEPILSLQIESEQAGGVMLAAKTLLGRDELSATLTSGADIFASDDSTGIPANVGLSSLIDILDLSPLFRAAVM